MRLTVGQSGDGTAVYGIVGQRAINLTAEDPYIGTDLGALTGAKGLGVQTRLNGEVMQDANTDDMIFPVDQTIAILSEVMTLKPGDMIAMGTPPGVGHARKPPVWMKAGDVVEVEIEGIGVLRNPIVDEVNP